ncbi:hypothetical protein [Erythrobacter longus]|nr:hypothetical protein [Erythrobacter longus]
MTTSQEAGNLDVGVNYIAIISPHGSLGERNNHIPQASVAWSF